MQKFLDKWNNLPVPKQIASIEGKSPPKLFPVQFHHNVARNAHY